MSFQQRLVAHTLERTLEFDAERIALLGLTPAALAVRQALESAGLGQRIVGLFDPEVIGCGKSPVEPWGQLRNAEPDLLVICVDAEKEDLLRAYRELVPDAQNPPQAVLVGMGHLAFRDPLYADLDAPALVPSYATGHPYTRVHLFQCLRAAAAAGLGGAVVELGAFKGGTSAWLARVVQRLRLQAQVVAFDSWSGFPPRRSVLDLYEHPRCVFDLAAVRAQLEPLGVELVEGDIADTLRRLGLRDEPVLLAFVDTDNYSAARAALVTIVPNLVAGGAVVLDHYWTTDDYVYTIGERIAAQEILSTADMLQIHATGVFIKLR